MPITVEIPDPGVSFALERVAGQLGFLAAMFCNASEHADLNEAEMFGAGATLSMMGAVVKSLALKVLVMEDKLPESRAAIRQAVCPPAPKEEAGPIPNLVEPVPPAGQHGAENAA